jgi:hypothetical protein
MSSYRALILLMLFSLWCATAVALTEDEINDLRKQFNGGLSNADSNEAIHDRLQQLLEQEPDNPLLLVYYGSTETLLGKYAWMPWNKLGYVHDGIAHIDRALRLAEQNSDPSMDEVQLVATSTYVSLPDMFNTFDSGKKLLAQLLALEPQRKWPSDFRLSLYSAAAKVAQHDGDRRAQLKWLARATALSSDSTIGVKQP